MKIIIIAALAKNGAIGKNNQLLWHLPNDLKNFKNLTWGMPILMGRKTFESIGSKPLPGRINMVLSRHSSINNPDIINLHSFENAIDYAKAKDYKEIFVIGGSEIYTQLLPLADKLYLTKVGTTIEGDSFFPKINEIEWTLKAQHNFSKDAKHLYQYSFETWEKN